jgi:hypothetical protein
MPRNAALSEFNGRFDESGRDAITKEAEWRAQRTAANVRFGPDSGQTRTQLECPLSARSGHANEAHTAY